MQVLGAILMLVAVAAAPTQAATATRLDGSSVEGDLQAWESDHIVLVTAEGEVRLATKDLVALRWPQPLAAEPSEESTHALVELVDGTVLPATALSVAGSQMEITLPAMADVNEQRLSVPVSQAVAVQFRRLDAQLESQWQEIRDQEFASDVLVVLKKNGSSLDYVEGVLGDITAEKIEFKLEGDAVKVDREKAAGFLYHRRTSPAQADAQCVLAGRSGLRAHGSRVQFAGSTVRISSGAGPEFDWPVADIQFADFSAGKIVYLSDIRQATVQWSPLIGLPAGAELLAKYGQPRRDKSAFGGPLSVAQQDGGASVPSAGTRSFGKGFALRSRTELALRLPAGYRSFLATAAIDPATRGTGSLQLSIFGDDQLLHEGEITGDQAPLELNLDVARVKRLKIIVDFGKNLDTGDWLNLCDARLVK